MKRRCLVLSAIPLLSIMVLFMMLVVSSASAAQKHKVLSPWADTDTLTYGGISPRLDSLDNKVIDKFFGKDSKSAASDKGLPGIRTVKGAITSSTASIEDAAAGITPALDYIVLALTKPLTDEEKTPTQEKVENSSRIIFSGSIKEVNQLFYKRSLKIINVPKLRLMSARAQGAAMVSSWLYEAIAATQWPG